MEKLIYRKYVDEIIGIKGKNFIKIITGIRRSGKSKSLVLFIEYIKKNIENLNLVYINFNELDYEELKDYKKLNAYILKNYKENYENILIIDEVQLCDNFELTINSIFDKNIYDIYLTGSNAFLQSSDLATLFTGRDYQISIFPFSFIEYLQYFNELHCLDKDFESYLIDGGMSNTYELNTIEEKDEQLKQLYNTIFERDIKFNKKIKNLTLFNLIASFLLDNIGNITSLSNIAKELNKNGFSTNDKIVGRYVSYLLDSFLFYKIKRYDIVGKRYLSSSYKYYLVDHTFKRAILGKKNINYGGLFENIVAIELLRRKFDTYVGILYKKEIDFVAIKDGLKTYIQVSYDIDKKETFEREIAPLLKIKDSFQKILIARTKEPPYFYEGIKIIDIEDWLKNESM